MYEAPAKIYGCTEEEAIKRYSPPAPAWIKVVLKLLRSVLSEEEAPEPLKNPPVTIARNPQMPG